MALSIVALADLFPDKLEAGRQLLKNEKHIVIPDERCFTGFDAYKKVCELPVDLVLIASPNCFHSAQMKYAVEQGKHVFVEKPAAIDAVGYRTFLAAVRQAVNTGLSVLPGTQYHFDRPFVASYQKIQEGLIGKIESAYTGKECTWEQLISSDLDVLPKEMTLTNVDLKQYEVPLAGISIMNK